MDMVNPMGEFLRLFFVNAHSTKVFMLRNECCVL